MVSTSPHYEVHAHEAYHHEMHARKMHTHEVHASEVHAHETLINGGVLIDLPRSELQKPQFRASCGVVPIARRKCSDSL